MYLTDQLLWRFVNEQKNSCHICSKHFLFTLLFSSSTTQPLFPCFLTQGTSQGGFLHPGAEDKSLSKTQLELTENTTMGFRAASMEATVCPEKPDKTSMQ